MTERKKLTDEQRQMVDVWMERLVRGLRALADGLEAKWREVQEQEQEQAP